MYFSIEPEECQDLPEILKPTEVAEFLCIHKNTVYKLIKRGGIYLLFVWENPGESPAGIFLLFFNRWPNTKNSSWTQIIQEEFFLYNPSSQLTETSRTLEKTGNS